MDSLTQFVLGAGVGVAVLGRRIGPRKAAITGGLLGTLPDLDVVVPFEDPVDAFILHRGPSHSFFVQALVTPLFGEALLRLFKDLRGQRLQAYLAVYLCFATHALLDALTVYGTRIFWPIWPDPVAIGSVFIIDPLYSLPLLILAVWALCLRAWTPGFGRALTAMLVVTTAYLGWSLTAQQMAQARAQQVLAETGVEPQRLLAIPTPFNTLFWRAIAVDGERYLNLYLPVFGPAEGITVYSHPRGGDRIACLDGNETLDKLAAFSKGFYRIDRQDGEIIVSDLRMGLTPSYVFRFAIARETENGIEAMRAERRPTARTAQGDWDWLLASLAGRTVERPVEAGAAVAVASLPPDGAAAGARSVC